MKALRIILTQAQANYRREESVENKMTYPLPPYSTVIGALHKACGYKEYHPMDVSIQGTYEAMQKEPYRDHMFLNSCLDDRANLVKLNNGKLLSKGYQLVAKAQKSQGNSFEKEITIDVVNRQLLTEYQDLVRARRALGNDFVNAVYNFDSAPCLFVAENVKAKKAEDKMQSIAFSNPEILQLVKIIREQNAVLAARKAEIKGLKTELKTMEKGSDEHGLLKEKIQNLEQEHKQLAVENSIAKGKIDNTYQRFASLTTSLKYYEVLYGVKLIIHVSADEAVLRDINENICNLTAIGRSEDFVDVQECTMVELTDAPDYKDGEIICGIPCYIKAEAVKESAVVLWDAYGNHNINANGTKYYLNKTYEIRDNKRIFSKSVVIYASHYSIEDIAGNSCGISWDPAGYLVSLV